MDEHDALRDALLNATTPDELDDAAEACRAAGVVVIQRDEVDTLYLGDAIDYVRSRIETD